MNKLYKRKLIELVNNHNNLRVPLSSSQRKDLSKYYPYYGAQGIVDYVDNFIFDGEYLLVAEDGENLRSQKARVCNLVEGKFWVNNHAHILSAKSGNSLRYVYYKLNEVDFLRHVSGSAQPKLTKESLEAIELFIHAPSEQERISENLRFIDQKIEVNGLISAELESLAKTIYDFWFTQFDFPDDDKRPYRVNGGDMVFNDKLKKDIPIGWRVGYLSELGDIIGGATPSKSTNTNFCTNGHSWITPNDLSEASDRTFVSKGALDITEAGAKSANLKFLPKGSVLLSSRAPVGYMAIASRELTTNQGFKSLIPNKGYSTEFVYFAVKNSIPTIINFSTGSTFKEISGDTLKSVPVILPPMPLVSSFTHIVAEMFLMREVLEEQNEMLKRLRDWLLPMLLNDQVTVQDRG